MLGTVGYMSPEQVRGQPADPRSDLFSLGAVLYEMLSGRRAFQADTAAETMSAILKEEPPDARRLSPPALERVWRGMPREAAGGALPVGPRPGLRPGSPRESGSSLGPRGPHGNMWASEGSSAVAPSG